MSWVVTLPADTSKMKLSAGYIRNNESALQTSLTATTLNGGFVFIPTTAPVWFYLDAAPSGWAAVAVPPTDSLIALKGGVGDYNHAGGTVQGAWTGAPVALSNALQNAPHTHTVAVPALTVAFDAQGGPTLQVPKDVSTTYTTASSGGAMTHQHDWGTLRPQAALGILCTKLP